VIDTSRLLSYGEEITEPERKSAFVLVRLSAHGSPGTVLSMAIPRTWKQIPEIAPSARPGWLELVSYAPSNSASAHVFQARQEYEVDLTDWVRYQAQLLSMTLRASRLGGTKYGEVVHAAATGKDGDRFRLVACGDGQNLFFFVGRAAAAEPPETGEILGLIAASFFFEQHSGRTTREDLLPYVDASKKFQLVYPVSWTVEPGAGKVDFRVVGNNDTMGYVHVVLDTEKLRHASGLRDVLQDAITEVEQANIAIETLKPIPAGPNGGESERWVGTCDFPAGKGQLYLLLRNAGTGWIRATVMTPDRDLNPMMWMRGNRFYEILCGTLGAAGAQNGSENPGLEPHKLK
jgi:hypothetical protein